MPLPCDSWQLSWWYQKFISAYMDDMFLFKIKPFQLNGRWRHWNWLYIAYHKAKSVLPLIYTVCKMLSKTCKSMKTNQYFASISSSLLMSRFHMWRQIHTCNYIYYCPLSKGPLNNIQWINQFRDNIKGNVYSKCIR